MLFVVLPQLLVYICMLTCLNKFNTVLVFTLQRTMDSKLSSENMASTII